VTPHPPTTKKIQNIQYTSLFTIKVTHCVSNFHTYKTTKYISNHEMSQHICIKVGMVQRNYKHDQRKVFYSKYKLIEQGNTCHLTVKIFKCIRIDKFQLRRIITTANNLISLLLKISTKTLTAICILSWGEEVGVEPPGYHSEDSGYCRPTVGPEEPRTAWERERP